MQWNEDRIYSRFERLASGRSSFVVRESSAVVVS